MQAAGEGGFLTAFLLSARGLTPPACAEVRPLPLVISWVHPPWSPSSDLDANGGPGPLAGGYSAEEVGLGDSQFPNEAFSSSFRSSPVSCRVRLGRERLILSTATRHPQRGPSCSYPGMDSGQENSGGYTGRSRRIFPLAGPLLSFPWLKREAMGLLGSVGPCCPHRARRSGDALPGPRRSCVAEAGRTPRAPACCLLGDECPKPGLCILPGSAATRAAALDRPASAEKQPPPSARRRPASKGERRPEAAARSLPVLAY